MGFNRLILIFHHIYGKGNMLHTQVSKVMQVKKQKNLLFPCVCPRTSAIHQHNSGKKKQPKSTNIDIVCKISI